MKIVVISLLFVLFAGIVLAQTNYAVTASPTPIVKPAPLQQNKTGLVVGAALGLFLISWLYIDKRKPASRKIFLAE